jgi:glutathione synthase/RimK-type ligase-like ATP-grasp enzyme
MSAPDIVLVTGRRMPIPDLESHLLVTALRDLGLVAAVQPWGSGYEWRAAPLVVVRTPWDYFEARAPFLDWARGVAAVTSLVNPFEVVEWNSHKGYLLDLRRAGVPAVETTVVARGASIDEQAAALGAHVGEVVVKPAVGGGAMGAVRAGAASAAARRQLAALAESGDALVQPLAMTVTTRGEISLVYFGGEFSHAVRKVPAAGDYRVQAEHGGRVEPHEPSSGERTVASAALAQTPRPTTYGRVDLVDVGGTPTVMELEVIEPQLFLDRHVEAPQRFADQLARELRAAKRR